MPTDLEHLHKAEYNEEFYLFLNWGVRHIWIGLLMVFFILRFIIWNLILLPNKNTRKLMESETQI